MGGREENFAGLVQAVAESKRLRRRKLALLPLRGSGAVFTDVQGRGPGDSTAPSALADLISSISEIGLLQPVLVEQDGEGHHLVAGERRLRAMRWGATSAPENPHFQALPAIVCPGPLTEEERRRWQLVENLARERLQPGELAAALMYERCALLTERLDGAGIRVPKGTLKLADPVARFEGLEHLRGTNVQAAAPWADVLRRIGVQMSTRKARAVVAAFRAMPRELSADMDAHQIALTTRMTYLRLAGGRGEAAEEIWSAVKQRGRTDLLSAAVEATIESSELSADAAVETAQGIHEAANASRSAKLTMREAPAGPVQAIGSNVLQRALVVIRELCAQLREGRRVEGFEAGSLRLLAGELQSLLDGAES